MPPRRARATGARDRCSTVWARLARCSDSSGDGHRLDLVGMGGARAAADGSPPRDATMIDLRDMRHVTNGRHPSRIFDLNNPRHLPKGETYTTHTNVNSPKSPTSSSTSRHDKQLDQALTFRTGTRQVLSCNRFRLEETHHGIVPRSTPRRQHRPDHRSPQAESARVRRSERPPLTLPGTSFRHYPPNRTSHPIDLTARSPIPESRTREASPTVAPAPTGWKQDGAPRSYVDPKRGTFMTPAAMKGVSPRQSR